MEFDGVKMAQAGYLHHRETKIVSLPGPREKYTDTLAGHLNPETINLVL